MVNFLKTLGIGALAVIVGLYVFAFLPKPKGKAPAAPAAPPAGQ